MALNTQAAPYTVCSRCRVCGEGELIQALEFGEVPLADRLLKAPNQPVPVAPLTLMACASCHTLQLRETVSPAALFGGDYPYVSSVSSQWLEHCRVHAEEQMTFLKKGGRVLEIGSNDGYLLQYFHQAGFDVLGVDPSPRPAQIAIERGIPTRIDYFSSRFASELGRSGKRFDLVLANNLLAHVENQNDVVSGMAQLLSSHGRVVIEVPYVCDLVQGMAFDTIYHQHLCYFSLHSLVKLFGNHGLKINDVKPLPTHGGSMRVTASFSGVQHDRVTVMLNQERSSFANFRAWYESFSENVVHLRQALENLLNDRIDRRSVIDAWGAAAKATTLLAWTGIGASRIRQIVDSSQYKQGWYFNIDSIPIVSPVKMHAAPPDYVMILAWNWAEEIMSKLQDFRSRGGRVIIPLPEPRIV